MAFLHSHRHLSLFHRWSELRFSSSNLYLNLYICFANAVNSFVCVTMLNTFRFKSSALFGIHTLLDKSVRVLQLPTRLSNSTVNE